MQIFQILNPNGQLDKPNILPFKLREGVSKYAERYKNKLFTFYLTFTEYKGNLISFDCKKQSKKQKCYVIAQKENWNKLS